MNAIKYALLLVCYLVFFQSYAQKDKYKRLPGDPVPEKVPVVNDPDRIDFSPTISADGRLLIFESDRHEDGKWMLYESVKGEDGQWSAPIPINAINDKCDFVAGPNISYDGNTLYYTAFINGVSETEDIYYSVRTGQGWSEPIKFTDKVNTDPNYEGFCSISSDGKDLYYIALNPDYHFDRKNKESCFNILVTHRDNNGEWSEPEKLPEIINSACVRDPKIMADNRTLLFSKILPGQKGKYDMYQSTLRIDGTWTEPISLRYVNTKLNNQAPGIPASGDIMYFYSDGDIYTVEIPQEYRQFFNATIYGVVSDFNTDEGLPAKVIVKDANTLETMSVQQANDQGEYSIVLNARRNYIVEFAADNYLSQSFRFDLQDMDKYYEEEKNVKLKSNSDMGIIVYDKPLNEPIPATITVYENNKEVTSFELSDYENAEPLSLPVNKEYKIVASSDSYYPETQQVNTNDGNPLNLRFYLEPKTVAYTFNTKDGKTKEKQRSILQLRNNNRNELLEGTSDDTFQLRQGDEYDVLTYGNKGYLQSTEKIEVAEVSQEAEKTPVEHNIDMTPLDLGVNFTLNNIYFETNSAQLSPSSVQELERLLGFLNLNANISVEISAHTDDVGTNEYNIKLSHARAASVFTYLVSKGIDKNRLQSKGYGETKPVVPNTNAENRSKNRRVEMTIIKID